ncbi:MAG TPA: hypothetical protein VLI06_11150 [Solimonas sp.]|nr:hypothetical protein [Solimonas sp.]
MKTRLILRPGQNGTKKLLGKYGARLLAVRYRYDAERGMRLKTVELIEEEMPWEQPRRKGIPPDTPVLIRVDYDEGTLRRTVRSAGGIWDSSLKLWRLPYLVVQLLHLESRIVP